MSQISELDLFVKRLQSANRRIDKERILLEATEFQKKVLEFLFNPYKITGISKKKLTMDKISQPKDGASDLLALLDYLVLHNTGRDVDIEYAAEVASNSGFPELVCSIVRKDLTLGVSSITLNKVFGKDFIPTFGVMLADKYFDDPEGFVPQGSTFIITEKLDGVRCVLVFDDLGSPHFYARSGREFDGMVELECEARKLNPSFVYDGELIVDLGGTSNEGYRNTMSVVGSNGVKRGLIYHVFDMILEPHFKAGFSPVSARVRKEMVRQEIDGRYRWIQNVPIWYSGTDKSQIDYWLSVARSEHKEGIMINLSESGYETKRSLALLKVKTFNECEGFVISLEEGTGKNSNRLGAVKIKILDKAGRYHIVRVGSGFKDFERDLYWKNQSMILNKVVEVGYFEITENQSDDSLSLRFPTWLGRIRQDKDLKSMSSI